MRYVCITLLILVSPVATASAQEDARATVAPDVIARLMSFDRDRDGKVATTELSERMQGLVARGDSSGDGALDVSEVRTLAATQSFVVRAHQGLSGGYGFADTTGQSSRNHIDNSIDDLRLAPNASEEAKRIAVAFVDEFEGAARDNFRQAIAPLIAAEKLAALERDLKTLGSLRLAVSASPATAAAFFPVTSFHRLMLAKHQLSEQQLTTAVGAIETFTSEQQLDEARRSELLSRLRGLLTTEEGDNLNAALARRPLAKANGLRAGIHRLTTDGFTITPVVR